MSASSLGGTISYTEGAAAVALDTNAVVYDAELAAAGSYAGASITLSRVGGASSEDVFSALGTLKFDLGRVLQAGVDVGSVANANGTLTITFNANATQLRVNTVLESIGYANTSDVPPSKVDIGWTFRDGASATALSVSDHTFVSVSNVNDKPTGQVTIEGAARYGYTLGAANTLADAEGLGSLRYQWLRNGSAISGATSDHYTVGKDDAGQRLSVKVSYTDGMGTAEQVTSASVAAAPRDFVLWRNLQTGHNYVVRDATSSATVSTAGETDLNVRVVGEGDFDGDGSRDVLWRNLSTGKNFYWSGGNYTAIVSLPQLADSSWQVAGIGDFNGDGKSDILWRQGYSGNNLLWDSGTTGRSIAAETDLNWKVAGIGDFNGDGKSDIFWLNTLSSDTRIWFSGNASQAQQSWNTGSHGWRVAGVGDFNGDGRDDIFWRHTSGENYVWSGADPANGYSATSPSKSDAKWQVVGVGDYDGDGRDDVLWRSTDNAAEFWKGANPGEAQSAYTPTGTYGAPAQTNAAAPVARAANDFDGDGISDLVWRHGGEGYTVAWSGAQAQWYMPLGTETIQSWKIAGVGDFDGDGQGDYFWRNVVTGDTALWRGGDAGRVQALARQDDLTLQVAGVGDFDGDGKSDVLWHNTVTGGNSVWFSATEIRNISGISDAHNIVAGVGDFNGDARSDILWRNTSSGSNTLWLNVARPELSTNIGSVSLAAETNQNWRVAAVGDFDGDGRDDLFWRKADGSNAIWGGGNQSESRAAASMADTKWQVMGVGDYNGDGRDDLFWRHDATGATRIWYGASAVGAQDSSPVQDPYWQPVPQTQAAARSPALPNADFTRDGHSDLFWRNVDTGETGIWPSAGPAGAYVTQSNVFALNQNWIQVGLGDFNADGTSDVLWRNKATFDVVVWDNGDAAQSRVLPLSTTDTALRNGAWGISGIGDFNADGASDLFWHNASTGANTIWYSGSSKTTHTPGQQPSVNWIVAGVGDFNGDGSSDVLWRDRITGDNTIWENGYSGRAVSCIPKDLHWHVSAIGDFNGDGRDELFWRKDSGDTLVWNDPVNPASATPVMVSDLNWQVVAVGDYNGDGRDDLFWRNTATGEDKIWDSADSTHAHAVDTVAQTSWQIHGQTNVWLF